MASELSDKGKRAAEDDAGLKRRGLLRLGTLVTAITGATAISAHGTTSAQAAPGDKPAPNTYVPLAEKGAPSGVACLDGDSKIPSTQLPDLSAAYGPTAVQMLAAFNTKTHVTAGPSGNYSTITDALAAYPNGNVDIELMGGTIVEPGPLPVTANHKYVTVRGQGMNATRVQTPSDFLDAPMNADAWKIRDFTVECTTATNTFNGIRADYPRRWDIEKVSAAGFGGTTFWYRGGIHSRLGDNYCIAKDASNINGYAGFRVSLSSAGVVATTFRSEHNYVGSGKQYGFLYESTNVGTILDQDTAELCDIGMRFVSCSGELRSPYTEANRVAGIESHDSSLVMSGRFRDLPILTWTSVASVDRFPVYSGPNVMNAGKALIFPPNTSPVTNPSLYVAIRTCSATPNGIVTGVPGGLVLRNAGTSQGRVLYVKESGAGNTGWVPVGTQNRTTADLNSATSSANTPDKYQGQCIYNTTVNRPVWATGTAPTATWVYADGGTAHTPS